MVDGNCEIDVELLDKLVEAYPAEVAVIREMLAAAEEPGFETAG